MARCRRSMAPVAAGRCPRFVGRRGCGEPLVFRVDDLGHLRGHCPRCARRDHGICRDCPAPITVRCVRCRVCAKRARRTHVDRFRREHPEIHQRANKQWERANRGARSAQRKAWAHAHPGRDQANRKRRKGLRAIRRVMGVRAEVA